MRRPGRLTESPSRPFADSGYSSALRRAHSTRPSRLFAIENLTSRICVDYGLVSGQPAQVLLHGQDDGIYNNAVLQADLSIYEGEQVSSEVLDVAFFDHYDEVDAAELSDQVASDAAFG